MEHIHFMRYGTLVFAVCLFCLGWLVDIGAGCVFARHRWEKAWRYLLLLLGVLDVAQLRRKRPLVIVVIFVLAALFSPPDVLSQLLLAVPAWLLFEAGMVFFNRRFPVCGEPDEVYRETGETGTDENGGEDV